MGLLIPTFHVRIKTRGSIGRAKTEGVKGRNFRGHWCARGFVSQPVQVITSAGCCSIQWNSVQHFYCLIQLLTMPRVQESQEVGGNIGRTLTNTHTHTEPLTDTFCSLAAANFITSPLLHTVGSENARRW